MLAKGKSVALPPKEFGLADYMASNPNVPTPPYKTCCTRGWGPDYGVFLGHGSEYLRVFIQPGPQKD